MHRVTMAIKAIAIEFLWAFQHDCHRFGVAAEAIFLDDILGAIFGPDGVRDISKDEGGHMVIARTGLDQVFGDQRVRCMAVVAVCPLLMRAMVPALVDSVHHMAIVTGRGVIAQVSSEIGNIQANRQYSKQ